MNTRRKKIEAIAIAAIMVVSIFAGILPTVSAYQEGGTGADATDKLTNVTVNATYSPFGADAYNITYVNALVNLDFSIHLNGTLNPMYTNLTVNLTNLIPPYSNSLNYTFTPGDIVAHGNAAHNITNMSFNSGWNCSGGSTGINTSLFGHNGTLAFWNATTGEPINEPANGTLRFTLENVTMPATAGNYSINVSAYNATIGTSGYAANNWTNVYLWVKPDTTKPTISDIKVNGVVGGKMQWLTNATCPTFSFTINDTESGVRNSSIKVALNGTEMINGSYYGTVWQPLGVPGNVTRQTRNVTVTLDDPDYKWNLTPATEHTITVTATDSSTNVVAAAKTTKFTVPRIVMNATNRQIHADVLNVVANGSDPVNITAKVLNATGWVVPDSTAVMFASDPHTGITWDKSQGQATNDVRYLVGNATINATFTNSGTYTIKATASGLPYHTIVVNVVKDIAGVTLEVNKSTLNATGTDEALFTATAIAVDGTEIPRSGYQITIISENTTSHGPTSGTWNITSGTTDMDGKAYFTLTSSTQVETVDTYASIVLIPTGTNTSAIETVNFVTGFPSEMDAFTDKGTLPLFSDYDPAAFGDDHLNVSGLTAGTDVTLTVRVNDSSQHPITDRPVTFTRIEGLGTFAAEATSTIDSTGDATGNYTAVFTLDTTASEGKLPVAASAVINVTISGNESLYHWFDLNTTNATADHVVVSANPTGLPADNTTNSTITAKIVDEHGNNVSDYAGVAYINFTKTAGTLNRTSVLTNATGFAVVNLTSSLVAETATITATANLTTVTLPGGNYSTCDVTFGTAGKLAIGANDTLIDKDTGYSKIWVQLQTEDGVDLGLQGKNVTFMVIVGNATIYNQTNKDAQGAGGHLKFDNCTATTNSTGAANVYLNGTKPISYAEPVTVQASSPDYPTFAPVSKVITLSGIPDHLELTNTIPTASNATGFRNSTVTVQVKDEDGNDVGAAKTVMFALTTDPGGTATLSTHTVTTNATTGNETTILYADTTTGAQTVTVTATSAGLTYKDITIVFPAAAAEPALTITANKSSVVVGTETPVLFTVTSDGTAVVGATVTLSGVATGSGTTIEGGLATILVNATSEGTIDVTASKTGCTDGTTMIEAREEAVEVAEVALNELLPNPVGTDTGDNEFIELYNYGDSAVDITDWKLEGYTLTGTIEADEYRVLWRNETGITLVNTGDTISLYNATDGLVDRFTYTSSTEGKSWARIPDGTGDFVEANPTPGEVNAWSPWIYDKDLNGEISKDEVLTAITDYFADKITKDQVLQVINIYFAT